MGLLLRAVPLPRKTAYGVAQQSHCRQEAPGFSLGRMSGTLKAGSPAREPQFFIAFSSAFFVAPE